ncbi:MAG: fused MFS/spermidine synthase [Thermoguttaceae bacterium]
MKHTRLAVTAFLCGAVVMVLEMTGSRMLAPYLGTSIIVWTSLIGIVLASLSFGYWYGGILADKYPSAKLLGTLIFSAAVFIAVVGCTYTFILQTVTISAGGSADKLANNLYSASVLSSILLFALPGALLGMVSPFVVRLAVSDVGSCGATVGRLYALSSVGSILGTFLGGFILVSVLKTGTILLVIAAVLVFVAVLVQGGAGSGKTTSSGGVDSENTGSTNTSSAEKSSSKNVKHRKFPDEKIASVLIPIFIFAGGIYQVYGNSLLPVGLHWETPYNHIRVYDYELHSTKFRALQTDPGSAVQTNMIIDKPNEIVSRYARYIDLGLYYLPETKRILVIGGGGYSIPKHVLTTTQNIAVDVVEIDPMITEVAKKFFGLTDNMVSDPRLSIFHEDARRFLRRDKEKNYDIVFGDAFNSAYNVPFHLTTKEYIEEVSDSLTEDGVFITNIISSVDGKKKRLFWGFHNALKEVFPQVEVFLVSSLTNEQLVQNIVLVGLKKETDMIEKSDMPEEIKGFLGRRWQGKVPEFTALSDDFAPVETYVTD